MQHLFRLHQALSTPIHNATCIERADVIFSYFCHWPAPPHTTFRLPFQHSTLSAMANALSPAPSDAAHLLLPPLPLPQLSLHQTPIQHPTPTQTLPSTWSLLYWLHRHRRSTQRAQSTSQAQATPKKNIPISAELSLRYWLNRNTIDQYTTIQLSSHDAYDQAWIHDHISNWMPSSTALSFPTTSS